MGGTRSDMVAYEGRMEYKVAAKPLDFSFMYIKTVQRKLSRSVSPRE